ncbi:MAG: NAD-dependent epimerase/dehydratase family protein [Actinomycetota bacterium]
MSATLVTGAAGFLGRALARALIDAGQTVALFDLAPIPPDLRDDAAAVQGDLGAWADVAAVFAEHHPDRVFHCGALLSALAEERPQAAIRANADGTYHVLEAARLFGARVVFTSTIATYGPGVPDPVSEDAPQLPATIYGVTKVYGERLGEYYWRRYGLEVRGIRFPSIVGPGRGPSGVTGYSSLMIDEPARGRPYTVPVEEGTVIPILYVDEAVQALIEFSDAESLARRMYTLAGISPTAAEIAEAVRSELPEARLEFAPDPATQAVLETLPRSLVEESARRDWGWAGSPDLAQVVKTFVAAVRTP